MLPARYDDDDDSYHVFIFDISYSLNLEHLCSIL